MFAHRHGAEIEQGVADAFGAAPPGTREFRAASGPADRASSRPSTRVAPGTTEDTLVSVYERAYEGATFVRLWAPRC